MLNHDSLCICSGDGAIRKLGAGHKKVAVYMKFLMPHQECVVNVSCWESLSDVEL